MKHYLSYIFDQKFVLSPKILMISFSFIQNETFFLKSFNFSRLSKIIPAGVRWYMKRKRTQFRTLSFLSFWEKKKYIFFPTYWSNTFRRLIKVCNFTFKVETSGRDQKKILLLHCLFSSNPLQLSVMSQQFIPT